MCTVETHKMATPSHKLANRSWLSSLLADGFNWLGKRRVANLGKNSNFPKKSSNFSADWQTTQTFFVLIKSSSSLSTPAILVDFPKDPQIMYQDNCRKLYLFWILLFHKLNTTQIYGWPIYDSRWPIYAFLRYVLEHKHNFHFIIILDLQCK